MEEGGGIGPLGEMLFGGLPLLRGKNAERVVTKKTRWMALRKLRGSFNLGDLGTGGRRLGWGQASKQAKLLPICLRFGCPCMHHPALQVPLKLSS